MLANLIGEIAKRRITINEIADCLGCHRNSVTNKIYGTTPFTVAEALLLHGRFFSDCDFKWLFSPAVPYSGKEVEHT